MTNDEINRKIAERCGPKLFVIRKPLNDPFGYYRENAHGYTRNINEAWKVTAEVAAKYVTGKAYENEPDRVIAEPAPIPNYCNDLNAMHEVEDAMTDEQCRGFFAALCEIIENEPSSKPWIGYVHATARQRSEAFLRTIGEWEETK